MDETSLITKLAVVETKLDELIKRLDRLDSHYDDEIKDLGDRVSGLERSKAWILGAGFGFGAIGGWLGDVLLHALK